MSVTIMDILKNADHELKMVTLIMWPEAREARDQLHNAIILLNKGYDVHITVDIDALVEQYGSIKDVPKWEYADA